jgi:hypothetical protein
MFDEGESQKLEELLTPYGEDGWELINITAELAIPVKDTISYDSQTIRQGSDSGRGATLFSKIRPAGGENVTTISIPRQGGGFDVKAYRAFFKRKKGLFG